MTATILLVADDELLRESAETAVKTVPGCRLQAAGNRANIAEAVLASNAALVLLHATGDETELQTLLSTLTDAGRSIPVLTISDDFDPARAVTLLRLGATDCLSRPLDIRRLATLIDVLTMQARLLPKELLRELPCPVKSLGVGEPFLYTSDEAISLVEQVRAVAPLPTTVLLLGETGTGKTRLARLIHDLSPRRGQPFVVVNCGALSASLVESELFGHVKGAFTGADADRQGKFAHAGAGTLVLDDIDALPLVTQSKLLRVLDERAFERLGGDRTEPMRARIIVATNRVLEAEVAAGQFRNDLYYRVHVISISVPPLRSRPELVEPLIRHYLGEFARQHDRAHPTISAEALEALDAYRWPGNIRELQNVVERALVLAPRHQIELSDLPAAIQQVAPALLKPTALVPQVGSRWLQSKAKDELLLIRRALAQAGNNRLRAAQELGMSRATLYKKLRRHGIDAKVSPSRTAV